MRIQVTHSGHRLDTTILDGMTELWCGTGEYAPALTADDLSDLEWLWEQHHDNQIGAHYQRGQEILARLPSMGMVLWKSLFSGVPVPSSTFNVSRLRTVVLDSIDSTFLSLPWELLRSEPSAPPLALSGVAITRCLARPANPLVETRLIQRILVAIARPSGLYAPSVGCVGGPMAKHLARTGIEVTLLSGATPERTRQSIEAAARLGRPYDLVHLDVHGVADGVAEANPLLLFESDAGSSFPVPVTEVLVWLSRGSVSTAVLSACRSIRSATYTAPAPLADIIGLSHELHPEAVSAFYGEFYRHIGAGIPAGEAVCRARLHLSEIPGSSSACWPTIRHLQHRASPKAPSPPDSSATTTASTGPSDVDNSAYTHADTWLKLDAALAGDALLNIFGLKGYGRSTLLEATREWLDTYLVAHHCLLLQARSCPADVLVAKIRAYADTCEAAADARSPEFPRRYRGAVLIDDLDAYVVRQFDTHLFGDQSEDPISYDNLTSTLADLPQRGIAVVCTSIDRYPEPGFVYLESAGTARSLSQTRGPSIGAQKISDLSHYIGGCPDLFAYVQRAQDPVTALADPWTVDRRDLAAARSLVSDRTATLLRRICDAALLAGLLTRAATIAELFQALRFVRSAAPREDAQWQESHEDFDAAVDALIIDPDRGLSGADDVDGIAESTLEIVLLRQQGLLTSDENLLIRTHPAVLAIAAETIGEIERTTGSSRLDATARLYVAHLFRLSVAESQAAVRVDLQISCLLYCARRGLFYSAFILLTTISTTAIYSLISDAQLGRRLRENVTQHCGGRPTIEQQSARWIWLNSFGLSRADQEQLEVLREELQLIEEEVASGLAVETGYIEHLRVSHAACVADLGRRDEAAALYTALAAEATNAQVKARALTGLAMLAIDARRPATAQELLDQVARMGLEALPGNLRTGNPHDVHLLRGITSTDRGEGWLALSSFDVAASERPSDSTDPREAGRRFHERGLAAIQLGHLTEGRRLLEEAVRLKGMVGDAGLLWTSYAALANLAKRENDHPGALRWWLAASDLETISVDSRLRTMTGLLQADQTAGSGKALAAQQRTLQLITTSIGRGEAFAMTHWLEWVSSLANSRLDELALTALTPVLERRVGDASDHAIALVLWWELTARVDDKPPQLPESVLSVLDDLVTSEPNPRNKQLFAKASGAIALDFYQSSRGTGGSPAEELRYSRMALRSMQMYCDVGPHTGDFGMAIQMAHLSASMCGGWTTGEWLQLMDNYAQIPAGNDIWGTESMADAVYGAVRGVGEGSPEQIDLVVQRLSAVLESAQGPTSARTALLSAIQVCLLGDTRTWLPNGASTAALHRMVTNRELDDESWYRAVQVLGHVCERWMNPLAPDQLQRTADLVLDELRSRQNWPYAGPASMCLMYDGIAACVTDLDRGVARAGDLRELDVHGCRPDSLVAELSVYRNLMPRLAARGDWAIATGLMRDFAYRGRDIGDADWKLDQILVVGQIIEAVGAADRVHAHQSILDIIAVLVASAPADDQHMRFLETAALAAWGSGVRAAGVSLNPQPLNESEVVLQAWKERFGMADVACQCVKALQAFVNGSEADAVSAVNNMILSAGRLHDVALELLAVGMSAITFEGKVTSVVPIGGLFVSCASHLVRVCPPEHAAHQISSRLLAHLTSATYPGQD